MSDLISREALKEAFKAWKTMDDYYHNTDCNDIPLSEAFDLIDNAPTVDISELILIVAKRSGKREMMLNALRPTGEWECARIGNKNYIVCSHCKERFETENTLELWQSEYRFCHRCGANMKKEAE